MGGGLIQLIAYGAQDLYLTGNPEKVYLILHTKDIQIFQKNLLKFNLKIKQIGVIK